MNLFCLAASVVGIVGSNGGGPLKEALQVLSVEASGKAVLCQHVTNYQGTTYGAWTKDRSVFYTMARCEGERRLSTVLAFPFKGDRLGTPRVVAKLPCEAPCHLSLSPDGQRLAFAAYGSATAGTVSLADGTVAACVHGDALVGPNRRRQEKAHAHCAFFTPDGARVGIVDLGLDRIFFYDPRTMAPDAAMTIVAEPGDGPRHAVFSRDGRFLFVLQELGNAVSAYRFAGGKFVFVSRLSTLPAGWTGESKAAAIKLTADGSLLMASNRGHDSIAFYAVDRETGRLSLRNIAALKGRFPRDFQLLPDERLMAVGHKRSNEIQLYRFDRGACTLEAVGAPLPCWQPLYFDFR